MCFPVGFSVLPGGSVTRKPPCALVMMHFQVCFPVGLHNHSGSVAVCFPVGSADGSRRVHVCLPVGFASKKPLLRLFNTAQRKSSGTGVSPGILLCAST